MTANRMALIEELERRILRELATGPATAAALGRGYGVGTVQTALQRLRATGVVAIRPRALDGQRITWEYLIAGERAA